ncbi:hypothetical protein [Longimicrobium sp.]|uniref:hypothetical protein n=1 Tax=Longimicrobium sp. TaxID=2029185 RepID=UPI002BBC5FF4|nr:hypothetical protein [Longimicrobium sp.]HSU15868.1 hypothetical protein [Longimicrobium sp.]
MKIRISLAFAALALAACGGPQPQDGPQPAGSGRVPTARDSLQRELFTAYRAAQMPSVYALIGARERLKLTSPQVTALDSIADAVREQNRPLTDSLRRFSRSGNGGPIRLPGNDAQRRDFIVYLRQIGDNNRRGLDAIQARLTPEQRTAVCAMAAEERGFGGMDRRGDYGGRGGGRGRGGGGMYGGGRGMRGDVLGDSIGTRQGLGGWPWCGPLRRPGGPRMQRDSARADTMRVRP